MAQTGAQFGSPTPAGILDQSASAAAIEVHTQDGPASNADGTMLKQQVVQIEAVRAMAQIITLLTSIDRRLAALEESHVGFSS